MLAIAARLVEFEHRGLAAIGQPRVASAVLPSVEARLVLPVVILATEHQRVLDPDEALPHGQADFRAGRVRIIEELLAAPALYRTPVGRQKWEQRARANLADELATLTGP